MLSFNLELVKLLLIVVIITSTVLLLGYLMSRVHGKSHKVRTPKKLEKLEQPTSKKGGEEALLKVVEDKSKPIKIPELSKPLSDEVNENGEFSEKSPSMTVSSVSPASLVKEPEKAQRIEKILRSLGLLSKEEALAQAVQEMTEEEKIKMFSDVSPYEVPHISLMLTIADRYDIDWLRKYVNNELQLRVSNRRLGRREFVHMVSEGRKQPPSPGRWERFKGKFGREEMEAA